MFLVVQGSQQQQTLDDAGGFEVGIRAVLGLEETREGGGQGGNREGTGREQGGNREGTGRERGLPPPAVVRGIEQEGGMGGMAVSGNLGNLVSK